MTLSKKTKASHGHGDRFATKQKPKHTKETLKRLAKYLEEYKLILLIVIVLVILQAILVGSAPLLIQIAIDDYIKVGRGIVEGLGTILIALAGIYIFQAIFTWLQAYLMIGISQKAIHRLRGELFTKLERLPLGYFDKHKDGDLMSRVTNDIDNISNSMSQSVIDFLSAFMTITVTIVMMFVINWILAIITIVTIPLLLVVIGYIGKKARNNFKAQQKELGEVNSLINENVNGAKVVQSFTKENDVIAEFNENNERLKNASIKAMLFAGLMGPIMGFLNNLRYAIVVASGSILTYYELATIGTISSFVLYSRQFGQPLNQMAQVYGNIQAALAGAERVFEVLDEPITLQDQPNAWPIEKFKGHVQFKSVDFSYDPDKPILKNVSLEATPGSRVALVGPTGAGKTTIINLLSRFYDINQGAIRIDGYNIKDIKLNDLRRRVGIVLQDTYLFKDSVKNNLRYGNDEATDETIIEACKMANCHDFIMHLPHGYDTILEGESSGLSHGQRQLISIARTLIKDPDILVLDEATSSVDTRTEIKIQEAMNRLMRGRTSFIIAHRLSTIQNADCILVLDHGEIIERGSHDTLLALKGMYHNLHNSHFETEL